MADRHHQGQLPSAGLIAAAAARLLDRESPADVAAGLHSTFCRLAVELTCRISGSWRGPVALGGGCLVNRRLLTGLRDGLQEHGFEVLLPRRLPPGDGGLSYGQAALAAAAAARGCPPHLLSSPQDPSSALTE
jgi:hydrogenase maturation protein HypF